MVERQPPLLFAYSVCASAECPSVQHILNKLYLVQECISYPMMYTTKCLAYIKIAFRTKGSMPLPHTEGLSSLKVKLDRKTHKRVQDMSE